MDEKKEPKLTWQAPEFEYRTKNVSWYWLTMILAVIIIGVAVWQRNFLFGFFVIMAEVLLLVWGNKKPELVNFEITTKGLTIAGREFYPYADIKSFAIEEDENNEWSSLQLKFHRRIRPSLQTSIPTSKSEKISKALSIVVEKVEPHQSLTESLERFFRF